MLLSASEQVTSATRLVASARHLFAHNIKINGQVVSLVAAKPNGAGGLDLTVTPAPPIEIQEGRPYEEQSSYQPSSPPTRSPTVRTQVGEYTTPVTV